MFYFKYLYYQRVYDEDNQAEDENIKEKKVQAETEDDLQNTVITIFKYFKNLP